jgi:hypothetical protein
MQKETRAKGRWIGIGIGSYVELTGIGSRISVAPAMPINTGTERAKYPHRFDRCDQRRLWCGLARAGAGNDPSAGRCRSCWRTLRGHPHRAWRQCRRSGRSLVLAGARRRSPRAQCVRGCLTLHRTCSKRRRPISSRKMEGFLAPTHCRRSAELLLPKRVSLGHSPRCSALRPVYCNRRGRRGSQRSGKSRLFLSEA